MRPTHDRVSKRVGFRLWVITAAVVAAVLVGVVAAYGLGHLGTKESGDAMQNAGDDAASHSTGAGDVLSLNDASPEDFYNDGLFSDIDRVAWANRQLQSSSADSTYPAVTVEEAAYERLQDQLAVEGRPPLGPLVSPSIQNTANEANILRAVAIAAAYYEEDRHRREKLLAAAFDNQHERSSEMRASLRNSHPLSAAGRLRTGFESTFTPSDPERLRTSGRHLEMATPYSKNRRLGTVVPIDGLPTRVVFLRDSRQPDHEVEEIQVYVGGRWTAHGTILPTATARWIPPDLLAGMLPR